MSINKNNEINQLNEDISKLKYENINYKNN